MQTKTLTKSLNRVLALVLTIVALVVGQRAMAWSGSGNSTDPYKITSPSDLNTLATNVNSGTSYVNTYFELTTNLSYSYTHPWDSNSADAKENNFTAIGGYGHSFHRRAEARRQTHR